MKNFGLILFLFTLISCTKPSQEPPIQDVIIIGGGLMGSASAWHLSNAGKSVLLFEKQDSIYHSGSSKGEARIARSNNRGNDIWSYLHNRSVKEVEVLINYLQGAGVDAKMEDIYTTSPVSYAGRMRIYDQLMASLERQQVDYKIASTKEEGRSLFGVALPDSVLLQREYNQHSGTINPEQLIRYLHQAVRLKGGQTKYQSSVKEIRPQGDYYEVLVSDQAGNDQTYRTKQIVSAAGPYTGSLLKNIAPYFDDLINPQRVFLAFIRINPEVYAQLSETDKTQLQNAYPVINSSAGTRSGSFFSMIENYDEQGNPIIKIGGHFQRSEIDNLDQVWKKDLSPEENQWSLDNTSNYFKLLQIPVDKEDLAIVDGYSCVYSLTETEVPLVTPLHRQDGSKDDNFIVMGGMSGVGGKGAMTYGLIAANLLTNQSDEEELYQTVVEALGYDRLLADLEK